MSDPAIPPFTQPPPPRPEVQYDNSGNPWFRDATGQWVRATLEASVSQPLLPPFEPRLNQSMSQPAAYNYDSFGTAQAASSSRAPNYTTNLRLPPLREPVVDDDLSDGPTIAKARGLQPALKVGGARQKGKGKRKRLSPSDSDDSDREQGPSKRKPGRPSGSSNFSTRDTNKVLDLVQKALPLGAKAWEAISVDYNKWAAIRNRPERPGKSVENKYKGLLKHKKPTGDPHCPPEVKRAHAIEALINQRADTRELSDSASVGAVDDDYPSDNSVEVLGSSFVRTAVARRAPSPPLPTRRARLSAPDLVQTLSKAFDPSVQKARDNERAERSLQSAHIVGLTGQLRDAQATNENLRTQLTAMQNQVNQAERARDRAELRLEMSGGAAFSGQADPFPPPRRGARFKNVPGVVRVDGKVRCETIYPDGGACTYWFSDPSDDEEEKENQDPSPPSTSPFPRDDIPHFTLGPSLDTAPFNSTTTLPSALDTAQSLSLGGTPGQSMSRTEG
ncbi:hypothetical protein C8F04DRAFT_1177631 [Mycena alexandri]|uniref:DUF6818 domain-containing protein n=1 Tax=Mycena alexandri TaxID=1745969 RepID=A0AAD6TB14_9AGAR|nr:hypothetical protein C8F04DRAFT_1177631 [Mycena alexandri]